MKPPRAVPPTATNPVPSAFSPIPYRTRFDDLRLKAGVPDIPHVAGSRLRNAADRSEALAVLMDWAKLTGDDAVVTMAWYRPDLRTDADRRVAALREAGQSSSRTAVAVPKGTVRKQPKPKPVARAARVVSLVDRIAGAKSYAEAFEAARASGLTLAKAAAMVNAQRPDLRAKLRGR